MGGRAVGRAGGLPSGMGRWRLLCWSGGGSSGREQRPVLLSSAPERSCLARAWPCRYTSLRQGRRRLLVPNSAFLIREFMILEEGPVAEPPQAPPSASGSAAAEGPLTYQPFLTADNRHVWQIVPGPILHHDLGGEPPVQQPYSGHPQPQAAGEGAVNAAESAPHAHQVGSGEPARPPPQQPHGASSVNAQQHYGGSAQGNAAINGSSSRGAYGPQSYYLYSPVPPTLHTQQQQPQQHWGI